MLTTHSAGPVGRAGSIEFLAVAMRAAGCQGAPRWDNLARVNAGAPGGERPVGGKNPASGCVCAARGQGRLFVCGSVSELIVWLI